MNIFAKSFILDARQDSECASDKWLVWNLNFVKVPNIKIDINKSNNL